MSADGSRRLDFEQKGIKGQLGVGRVVMGEKIEKKI